MNEWKNITFDIPEINLKPLIDYTSNIKDIYSVSIEEKSAVDESNWYDIPNISISMNGNIHTITFLVKSDYKINTLLELIKKFLNIKDNPFYHEKKIEDKNWIQYTQKQFKEINISKNFRIIAPWKNNTSFKRKTLIIDPGSGFGTGSHPTTQLCLKWIEKNINKSSTLIDYGSGSGVLSIAAKLFGAKLVEGIELDRDAINNSKTNNHLNRVNIPFYNSNTFKTKRKYNVIISNILLPTLIELSNTFKKLASKKIVLSGILDYQTEELIKSYDWVKLKQIDEMDNWALLFGEL